MGDQFHHSTLPKVNILVGMDSILMSGPTTRASTWIRTRTYATHPHFWEWNSELDAMVSSILSESHKLIVEIGDPHVPLRVSQKSNNLRRSPGRL